MHGYVAATLIMTMAVVPASAAGLGAHAGGMSVGAGVSGGKQGGSVGVGASVGGIGAGIGAGAGSQGASATAGTTGTGGTGLGASVGAGSGSVGVGVNVGSNTRSVGTIASTSVGDPSVTAPSIGSFDNQAVAPDGGAPQTMGLPAALMPPAAGRADIRQTAQGYPFGPLSALKVEPGTPAKIIRACRAAIFSSASPLGAVSVYAVSNGQVSQIEDAVMAPLKVRIEYSRQGVIQVREAKVGCRLDATGKVTAVI